MRALLAALLLLHRAPAGWALCFAWPKTGPDFSNQSRDCEVLDWAEFSNFSLPALNLSSNGIGRISGSARPAGSLRALDLSSNRLQSLPEDFFASSSRLESLSLQGNPLAAVPASAFHRSLLRLAVDCRCDVAGSAVPHCTCSRSANCTERACLCLAPAGAFNLTEFYARECWAPATGLVLAIAGSVLAVLLLAGGLGGAVCLLRRRRKGSVSQGKRESTASGAHGQPRYVSRDTQPAAHQGPCQAGDYENIFIGRGPPRPGGPPESLGRTAPPYGAQQPVDEECYMESDTCFGEQPIYSNTQHLESSFSPPHDPEDVYIIPDK